MHVSATESVHKASWEGECKYLVSQHLECMLCSIYKIMQVSLLYVQLILHI